MRSDFPPMDLEGFRQRYPGWMTANRHHLEEANWGAAFADFPFAVNATAPWSPLTKPLSESKVAVLTTAGLYLKGEQQPFNAENLEGDWSFRELPASAFSGDLEIAHTHYPHASAEADLNAVYPMERLRELVAAGELGSLAAHNYSISGYCTRIDLLVEEVAPPLVAALLAEQVDVVLHIPV